MSHQLNDRIVVYIHLIIILDGGILLVCSSQRTFGNVVHLKEKKIMCACIGLIDLHFHELKFVCRLAEGSKLDLKANPPRAALRANLLYNIVWKTECTSHPQSLP